LIGITLAQIARLLEARHRKRGIASSGLAERSDTITHIPGTTERGKAWLGSIRSDRAELRQRSGLRCHADLPKACGLALRGASVGKLRNTISAQLSDDSPALGARTNAC
ncbi:MAG: hypothetical protein ACOH2T_26715, partial [Pseudomonas sp.]